MNQTTVVLFRPHVSASTDKALITELTAALAAGGAIADPDAFAEAVWERESQQRTWLGRESAIPHARLADVKKLAVVIGSHPTGIEWGSDEQKARLFFLVAVPQNGAVEYLYLTQRITRTLRDETRRKALLAAANAEALARAWKASS